MRPAGGATFCLIKNEKGGGYVATLRQPRTEKEIRKLSVNNVREEYINLSVDYNRIINNDVLLCPKCGKWQATTTSFYMDKKYVTDRFPICKRCIMAMVEQRERDDDEPNETKESVQKVLQLMDKVYDDEFYDSCVKGALDGMQEKTRNSPFATYITSILSLPNWKGMTWKDSKFGDSADTPDEIRLNQKTIKAAKKRFGSGYTNEELMFLEGEYQDWQSRYECNTKAQEEVFENLAICKLLKRKALTAGKPTKDIDAQITNWMNTGAVQPKQNSMDAFSDAQTFGTLIQKFEEERPCPEIDPDFQDVDKIARYIDTYYKGHMCKMLEIDNNFSHLYEEEMRKYTVDKPQYDDEEDSESIFAKIFGAQLDG